MAREYTYQDLFEGEKFGLDSALRDGVDYEAFRGLRMLLLLSHNQINKLEARIVELERIHSSSNNIDVVDDLAKPKQVDEEPIEGFIERAIAHDMEVVFSGKPVDELSESQKELRKLLLNTWVTVKPDKFTREHDNQPVESSRLSKLKETVDRADAIVMGYVPDDFRS